MWKLASKPSQDGIDEVLRATGCRAAQARIYLQRSRNDVEEAIKLLKIHYPGTASPSDIRSNTPLLPDPALATPPPTNNSDAQRQAEHVPTPRRILTPSTSESNFDLADELPGTGTTPSVEPQPHLRSPNRPAEGLEGQSQAGQHSKERSTTTTIDSSSWDFRLPLLPPPGVLQPGGTDGSAGLSLQDCVASIQHGAPPDLVKRYLKHFMQTIPESVRQHINDNIDGFPAMFYVVAANNDVIIRAFEQCGGNINATYGNPPIPLLGFAVITAKFIQQDTSTAVATLLSLGVDAAVVPREFYSRYDEDLPSGGPSEDTSEKAGINEANAWCKPLHIRKLFTETLNITQRYCMYRSSRLAKPTERQMWVAARHDATDLFAVPYFLIGQVAATSLITRQFLHYMLRPHRQPLVLVFAGPSGHGKTELARRLGELLSLSFRVSDCTIVTRETELFGPRKPYVGAEEGSPLNNFLAKNNNQKCIVFLDEFEKTTADIWNALLIPFDKGEYQDRRNLKKVDCSKAIWILATNALDARILSFCTSNKQILDEDDTERRDELLEELTSAMKEDFISVFKPPLTGRISAFVPFLPFSHQETCVGAHKYLLELINDVRRPINTTPGPDEQLLGNIRLRIRSDAAVSKIITKDYDTELGINSLKKTVKDRVASALDFEYMAMHDTISEGLPTEDYTVFASDGKIKVKRASIQ